METSENGIELIKKFEGFRTKAYQDIVGVWTIGYGSTRGVHAKTPEISEEEAKNRLICELVFYEKMVEKLIKSQLHQNQFDALVSFSYNLGTGALQRSTLRQRINRGDFAVGEEFLKWCKAGGKTILGLVLRRQAEAKLFASICPSLSMGS